MFKLLFKKSFFDFWDNMGAMLLMNLVFGGLLALAFFSPGWFDNMVIGIILYYLILIAMGVYAGLVARFVSDIADYQKFEFRKIGKYFKESAPVALLLSVLAVVYVTVLMVGFNFYLSRGGFFGVFGAAVFFWISFVVIVSVQYYYALRNRLEKKIVKAFKKCFMLAFDNLGASIFIFLWALVLTALSIPCLLFLPSVAGIMLWFDISVKLLLKKYDYLEEHPEADRRKIPWKAILMDEEERVGKRTLKGMIFPAKFE